MTPPHEAELPTRTVTFLFTTRGFDEAPPSASIASHRHRSRALSSSACSIPIEAAARNGALLTERSTGVRTAFDIGRSLDVRDAAAVAVGELEPAPQTVP